MKPTDIVLSDDGEVWMLSWTQTNPRTQREERCTHPLVGMDTEEEAIQDALAYFGGLVTQDQIRIQPQSG